MSSTKMVLVIIGVIIVAAIGYYVFVLPGATATPTNTNSQARLDINAICDGALAYMTFENGAAAEAWVAECKRGEHPEAIEKWKQMNGITDDRVI